MPLKVKYPSYLLSVEAKLQTTYEFLKLWRCNQSQNKEVEGKGQQNFVLNSRDLTGDFQHTPTL